MDTSAPADPGRRALLRGLVAGTVVAAGGVVWWRDHRADATGRYDQLVAAPPGRRPASELVGDGRSADGYEAIGEGSRRIDVRDGDELVRVLALARVDDRIVLAPGVYEGREGFVVRGVRGSAGRGLTIESSEIGGAVLRGAAGILVEDCSHVVVRGIVHEGTASGERETSKHALTIRDADHVRLTRSRLAMADAPGASVRDNDYVFIEGTAERNRIDHCSFGPKSTIGTFIYVRMNAAGDQVCRYTTIDHNHFDQLRGHPNGNDEPIRLGHADAYQSSAGTLFEHNLMTDCVADNEFVSVKSSDNIIRHNTFRGMFGALVLRAGDRNDVYGNVWFGDRRDDSGGITVNGGSDHRLWNNYLAHLSSEESNRPGGVIFEVVRDSAERVRDCVFVQNTIIDCPRPVLVGRRRQGYPFEPSGTLIANNLIVADSPFPLIDVDDALVTLFAGNVLSQSGRGGTGRGRGIPRDELRLEPTVSGLLAPAVTSPLRGAARPRWTVTREDLGGRVRPAAPTVGALEADGQPLRSVVLSPADVGPWSA